MSLFDGQPERGPERKRPKTAKSRSAKLTIKRKKPKYGDDKSGTTSIPTGYSKEARAAFTRAYERGEIKLEDTSRAFLLCRCCMAPDFHTYPHEPHTGELARFELEHYGKHKL